MRAHARDVVGEFSFQEAVIQKKVVVISDHPKELWVDWCKLVKSNSTGLRIALKDWRKREPEFEWRYVISQP